GNRAVAAAPWPGGWRRTQPGQAAQHAGDRAKPRPGGGEKQCPYLRTAESRCGDERSARTHLAAAQGRRGTRKSQARPYPDPERTALDGKEQKEEAGSVTSTQQSALSIQRLNSSGSVREIGRDTEENLQQPKAMEPLLSAEG